MGIERDILGIYIYILPYDKCLYLKTGKTRSCKYTANINGTCVGLKDENGIIVGVWPYSLGMGFKRLFLYKASQNKYFRK